VRAHRSRSITKAEVDSREPILRHDVGATPKGSIELTDSAKFEYSSECYVLYLNGSYKVAVDTMSQYSKLPSAQ
jgi:hypothetical protein